MQNFMEKKWEETFPKCNIWRGENVIGIERQDGITFRVEPLTKSGERLKIHSYFRNGKFISSSRDTEKRSITVSNNKSVEQIKKEIEKRLLPDTLEVNHRLKQYKEIEDNYEKKKQDVRSKLLEIGGDFLYEQKMSENIQFRSTTHRFYSHEGIVINGDSITMELRRLDVETAGKIIEVLRNSTKE